MHPLPLRFFLPTLLRFAAVMFLSVGLLAACDRHSAAELPESYGHGSSHEKSYTDHQADSRADSRSFSDTQGAETGPEGPKAEAETKPGSTEETPTASPLPSVSGHFFPSGH